MLSAQSVTHSRLILSSFLHENPNTEISGEKLATLLQLKAPTVPERGERLFLEFSRVLNMPGSSLGIEMAEVVEVLRRSLDKDPALLDPTGSIHQVAKRVLPLVASSWSVGAVEFRFLLDDYLVATRKHLERAGLVYKISGLGWEHLAVVPNSELQTAFVAMSFAPALDEVYRGGLEKGILAAGYRSVRIDKHEHVNRIDDEIIAQLRRSKFVVADFTNQRNGVYFEAGFGLGLGLPVFWTCRGDDLKNVHFDARQYNTIKWEPSDLPAFAKALTNRIVAVLGQGPY